MRRIVYPADLQAVTTSSVREPAADAFSHWFRVAVRAHAAELATAALLLVMAANLLSVIAQKSITIDETSAIPSGCYYLTVGAFDLNSEHPPLPKILAALPLLFLDVERPPLDQVPGDNYSQRTVMAAERFWTANRAHFQQIFFWARVPVVLTTIMLGVLIFIYAQRLFDSRAAVLAVALYSLEPNVLAHGRIIKDLYVALAYLFFFLAVHVYCSTPRLRNALLLGVATGLAPALKFSMVIVVPIFLITGSVLLVLAKRRGQGRPRLFLQLAAAAATALIVINASYLFQHQALVPADTGELIRTVPPATPVLAIVHWLSPVLPPYFIFGNLTTLAHEAGDHHVFLFGMYSTKGWWYYFPAAFAVKTTLPFLLLTLLAIGWAVRETIQGKWIFLMLLVPVAIYMLVAMTTSVNIGIRHFLPTFPFLFIMGGALLDRLLGRQYRRPALTASAALAVVAILIGWMTVAAIRAYPDYIPYMNELAWGRPHWQLLSDSNVEWGDDTEALAQYLAARGERNVRAAFLGGSVLLPLYGVEYVDLLAPPGTSLPETRYVALGASFLNGTSVPGWSEGSGRETKDQQRNYFAAYRNRQPEAVFGQTIYLYRVK